MVYPDSDYPGGIDSFPDPDTTLDGTPLHSELHLSHNDAIEKIETEGGVNPAGTSATVAARLAAFDAFETQISPDTVTLNDNRSAYLELTGSQVRGVVVVGGNLDSAGSALVAFRTADTAAFAAIMASDAPTGGSVAGFTSHMTGTSGADGNLNISAFSHATARRLYIENRTGGTRAYAVSFLALTGGTLNSGVWVIV